MAFGKKQAVAKPDRVVEIETMARALRNVTSDASRLLSAYARSVKKPDVSEKKKKKLEEKAAKLKAQLKATEETLASELGVGEKVESGSE